MNLGCFVGTKEGRLSIAGFVQCPDESKELQRFQLSNPDLGFFIPPIKRVIFVDKKTIVIWVDDTKTSVECQSGDNYDKQTGFCMAVCKKLFHGLRNVDKLVEKRTYVPKKHKKVKDNADKKSSV